MDPFLYCNVVDLNDCASPGGQGVLVVGDRRPLQLSVPTDIGRAPWRLLKVYADERDTTETVFRPGSTLAVTIPTVDPFRGRLMGIVVQLMTLVRDENEDLSTCRTRSGRSAWTGPDTPPDALPPATAPGKLGQGGEPGSG